VDAQGARGTLEGGVSLENHLVGRMLHNQLCDLVCHYLHCMRRVSLGQDGGGDDLNGFCKVRRQGKVKVDLALLEVFSDGDRDLKKKFTGVIREALVLILGPP